MIFQCPPLAPEELQVVAKIDDLRQRLNHVTSNTKRWIGVLKRSTFARAIQGSNSIEGYNVTFEDAIAAIENEEPLDAKTESWEAVKGYRDAMTYILQLSGEKDFSFSEDLIKSLHFIMIKYDLTKRPGRWRPGYIYVRNEQTGKIVYEGPDAELVPALIAELIEHLNSRDGAPVLSRAAMSHLNLVMIHPFSDGNGRMARALQTFVLAREGIVAPEFSSIEEYLGRNTQDYYNVLEEVGAGKWHPERNARPWIRFCLTAHYRQVTTLLRRTKEWERLWEEIEYVVQSRGLPERTIFALFDAALGWRVRNATYRRPAEISENLASRDLKEIADAKLLLPQGEKRGRYYVASPFLREMRMAIRDRQPIRDPFAGEEPLLPGFELPT